MGRSLLLSGHCRERPDIHGDSNVTAGCCCAAAVLQKSAIAASLSVTRIIALIFIILSFERREQKNRQNSVDGVGATFAKLPRAKPVRRFLQEFHLTHFSQGSP